METNKKHITNSEKFEVDCCGKIYKITKSRTKLKKEAIKISQINKLEMKRDPL